MVTHKDVNATLLEQLRTRHLPAFREGFEETPRKAVQETLRDEQSLLELTNRECDARRTRRIERRLRESCLPLDKTLSSFDLKRLPAKVARQMRTLLEGGFLDRRENVLAFGNSGSGKTHLLCALGQELIRQQERPVYFSPGAVAHWWSWSCPLAPALRGEG